MSRLYYPLPKVKKIKDEIFPGQFPDEKVIFLIRRHWSKIVRYVVLLFLAHALAVFIFILFFYILNWDIPADGPLYVLLVMVTSLYFFGAWLFYLHEFVDYHLDIWILTDKRILNIEQEGLFKRTAAELDILKIQDVTAEIDGKLQTFFNFGNVYIQTASEKQRFVFEEVDRPQEVAQQIIRIVEEATRDTMHEQAASIHEKFKEPQQNEAQNAFKKEAGIKLR